MSGFCCYGDKRGREISQGISKSFIKRIITRGALIVLFAAMCLFAVDAWADTGRISGKVVAEDTGLPIAGIQIYASPISAGSSQVARTDASGNYTLTGLQPGSYTVQAYSNNSYAGEYYNNVYSSSEAATVNVESGKKTGNIDFSLASFGSISGKVVADDTGLPIAGIDIYIYAGNIPARSSGHTITDAAGNYTIAGQLPGSYIVNAGGNSEYAREYYNNTYNYTNAAEVTITSGKTTAGINFGLALAGSISGKVIATDTGLPISGVYVDACSASYAVCSIARVGSDGNYTIVGLLPGPYDVRANGNNLYAGQSYIKQVTVLGGKKTTGIDFSLTQAGRISGKVIADDTGLPIANVYVYAYANLTSLLNDAYTDSFGKYTLTGLPAGSYNVIASSSGKYSGEYYDNTHTADTATKVNVTSGKTTTGIDFSLALGGSISGKVIAADTGLPIAGIIVFAQHSYLYTGTSAVTDASGNYTITGLLPGPHIISVHPNDKYAFEYYNKSYSYDLATEVQVVGGSTTSGINFSLLLAGSISGKVVARDSGLPISGLWINVHFRSAVHGGDAQTDASGNYTITGLRPGPYKVLTWGSSLYAAEYYNNVNVFYDATDVNVESKKTVTGIDFNLKPAGIIQGKVFADDSGLPLSYVGVEACPSPWGMCNGTRTDSSGNYTIAHLQEAPHFIKVYGRGEYAGEYYSNADSLSAAKPLYVTSGNTITDINFGLAPAGSISGKIVADDTGLTLPDIEVIVCRTSGDICVSAYTDEAGNYTASGLNPGKHRVRTSGKGLYAGEYYNNVKSYAAATTVDVTAGTTAPNIDFRLSKGGTIKGSFIYAGGAPGEVMVWISPAPGNDFPAVTTMIKARDDIYSMQVPVGTWYVKAFMETNCNDLYDQGEPFGEYAGGPITVTAGSELTGIDISFDECVRRNFYRDSDNDGFGDPNNVISSCTRPLGYVANSLDPDDSDASILPPPHIQISSVLLMEDFDSGMPATWTNADAWSTDTQCPRTLASPFTSHWIAADSSCKTTSTETLTTNTFSAKSCTVSELAFTSAGVWNGGSGKVAVSADNGAAWLNKMSLTTDEGPVWKAEVINEISGSSNARVRFVYNNSTDSGYWAIDNVWLMCRPAVLNFTSNNEQRTVLIENTGNVDLNVGNISISGPNASDFSLLSDNCSGRPVKPSEICSAEVKFTTTATGKRTAGLNVPSDDPDTAISGVVLTGMTTALGDPDRNGSVNIIDALFVARSAAGLSVGTFVSDAADVNCDGTVNIVDALFIARKAAGLLVSGWCGE